MKVHQPSTVPKLCVGCKTIKPASEFYREKAMVCGLRSNCKECTVAYYRTPERRATRARYKATKKARADACRRSADWYQRNKHKRYTHVKVRDAVLRGDITREPCRDCGTKKVDGHHPDYNKPLEVIWLCRRHHIEEHKRMREVGG